MRFAISLLTLVAVASVIGTVVRQNEAWVNYVNQFGPFWAGFFAPIGLFKIYNAPWFIGIMAFLVASTSLCVWRNTPKMIREMRVFRENLRESSLNAFSHRWEGRFRESPQTLPDTLVEWLQFKGFKTRVSRRPSGTMVAAKAGSGNRFGYIATHMAIIVICVGGLLDSGVPLKLAIWFLDKQPVQGNLNTTQIAPSARLGISNPSYRANLLLPEGGKSRVAVLNTEQGALLQDLPFELTLKQFRIDFYSTGMPRLFASDVQVYDRETNTRFDATIEVNKPLVYKGVTVYQSSFDDGGTHVQFKGIPLSGTRDFRFDLAGEIGGVTRLEDFGGPYSVEMTGFKSINVESMPVSNSQSIDGTPQSASKDALKPFQEHLASVTGPGVKNDANNRFMNVGPSVTYKLRDSAGQAKEFHNYMLPIALEGGQYYLAGVRESPAEPFQYLRIPADETGQLDGFMRLRAALQNPDLREQAAQNFAQKAFSGRDNETQLALSKQLAQSARRALDKFAGVDGGSSGLAAIAQFIEQTVPEPQRQSATDVVIRIIQGSVWELYQLSRAAASLPATEANAVHGRFVQDAQIALSDLPLYGAPVMLQLDQFQEIKASVFQVAKAPGQWVVYLGCLFLVIGVFSMFYIRERRAFFWVTADAGGSKLKMAMSTTRKTMDFENEYQQWVQELNGRASAVDFAGNAGETR